MPTKPPQSGPRPSRYKQYRSRFRRRARQPLSARARALRWRRVGVVMLFLVSVVVWLIANPSSWQTEVIYGSETSESTPQAATNAEGAYYASYLLSQLPVQASADGSTYEREEQFYSSWPSIDGCSLRQRILKRDFAAATLDDDNCTVIAGNFVDPYSSQEFDFTQKSEISSGVQIDHVVALSNAWQTGAQNLSADARYALATDPLNLIAAGAEANQDKSDGDASEWLPPNRAFRCEYVARQIAVKYKYHLWVTEPEHAAIITVLTDCPAQTVTGIETEKVSASTLSAFASISVKGLLHTGR